MQMGMSAASSSSPSSRASAGHRHRQRKRQHRSSHRRLLLAWTTVAAAAAAFMPLLRPSSAHPQQLPTSSPSSSLPSSSATTSTTLTPTPTPTPSTGGGGSGGGSDGGFVFGAWLNTGEYPADVDSPAKWNRRLGWNTTAFELRMSLPAWSGEPQVLQVEDWDDGTGAAVFMTVYADAPTFVWPTEADLVGMANKLHAISVNTGRQVFLRYLPEMDGPWMKYGAQPVQLVANWKLMASVVRRIAPEVSIVWSPNFDFENRGGAAFWPGPEYVDWVGTSQYWKSSHMGFPGNAPVSAGFFSEKIDFIYQNYAVVYNKPFCISEASYAWEISLEGNPPFVNNVTQAAAQQAYWSQVFDVDFLDAHPLFKMAFVFEYKKVEDNMYRDFRVSWDPATLAGVQAALQPLIDAGRLAIAGNKPKPSSSSSSSWSKTTSTTSTSAVVSSVSSTTKSAAVRGSTARGLGWSAVVAAVAVGCVGLA